jgi:4-oxalocrotonate tautomerase
MDLIELKMNQKVCTPARKAEITGNFADAAMSVKEGDLCNIAWVDIEQVLSEEWAIGGLAIRTDATRALDAGE